MDILHRLNFQKYDFFLNQIKSESSLDGHSNVSDESPDPSVIRFIVADCGGGTVDITLHELSSADSSLRELLSATGGPFGATGLVEFYEAL